LDEINGISSNPDFAHFIKALVDDNALSPSPLPLLLMLCGTPERRRQMIECHQPVERMFDVVTVEPLSPEETSTFFHTAFESVGIRVEPEAMTTLVHLSAGFPKIMHLLGDNAFWTDNDGVISAEDAADALVNAAEDVGRKYVDQQVYRALRSKDYQSILKKIAHKGIASSFTKREIEKGLTETEKKKLNNFLQRMKKLNVLRSGDASGEYVFNMRMVQLYIWLHDVVKSPK
jgi:hypothetical protein